MELKLASSLDFPILNKNITKTYGKTFQNTKQAGTPPVILNDMLEPVGIDLPTQQDEIIQAEELTTKNAVTFLLAGTLSYRVCKYCLNVTEELYEMKKVIEIASKTGIYSVTIKDMIASFHPFQVAEDPNFPNKVCNICLDRTIKSYLFTQQCEQAERAIVNCFDDINTKLLKLDPLEGKKHRRGRKKTCVNHNTINAEHLKVIDYADPIIHIINTCSESLSREPHINPLECLKCCQVLPNVQSLAKHSNTHPKSMWFNCRLCGKSFPKVLQLKKHYREHDEKHQSKPATQNQTFECKHCSETHERYYHHLQHLEKHRFKMVLEHLVYRKMDNLCSICFDKGGLVPLDKLVCIYGGPPDLMGDRTMQSILATTLPKMSFSNNYTGTKICEKCVDSAITSYNFISHTYFVRDRLNTCITQMLDSLKDISPENNLCIEISKETIMPVKELVDETVLDDIDKMETEDFLEDEYRVKSEEENDSEDDMKKPQIKKPVVIKNKINNKKEVKHGYLNGYQIDICSEFLTFKRKHIRKKLVKKFTCPKCNKHFLSDYFVKRHILKHVSKKVECKPCGTVFGNKFSLNEHTKYAHLLYQSDYRACKICGRGFAKPNKLKQHLKQHRNKTCVLCDKVFRTQRYYDCHMKRHIPKLMALKNKYGRSCSFCEKDCPNDNQLSLHVNKVHLQIKPYNCDMCEKQFYTEYNLRSHKKIHNKLSKEKCNFCSKTLKSRKNLVIHIRQHIGVTPHPCQICDQSFYSLSKLKSHMKNVHGGTIICKICKHVSMTKIALKSHIGEVHTFL